MSSYCADTDVKAVAPDWTSINTAFDGRVEPIIVNASKLIDEWTSSWFDSRALEVKTEPCREGQRKLFMPAPIVSVTSITENGIALAPTTYVLYRRWIEKSWQNPVPAAGSLGGPGVVWRPGQLNIVVTGNFGYTTPPADIVEATAYVAATIMGIRSKVTTDPSGVSSAKLLGELPSFIQDTITRHKDVGLHQQPFVY